MINMNIAHIVSTLGRMDGGGVSSSVYNLLLALHNMGVKISAYAMDFGNEPRGRQSFITFLANDCMLQPLNYSRNMRKSIKMVTTDCYHVHAIWQDFVPYTINTAYRKQKPCVVSLHGSFMRESLANCGFLKRIWWKYVLHPAIKKATCIHVTSEQEYEDFRLLGYKNPVAVIPNIFFPPDNIQNYTKGDNKFRVGYLGRLHPHKQIELLIEAWKELPFDDGELSIIGHGDDTYTSYLKGIAASHRVNNIKFEGFKEGSEKFSALAQCDLMCLPSKSENFSMVVAESLSLGIPVWSSKGAPWKLLNEYNCGWWTDVSIDAIKQAIQTCKTLSKEERRGISNAARQLINDVYSPELTTKQMIEMYRWVAGYIEKPDFIQL